MAGRIQVLPDEVVNRIAAGEVVERPASVVKELVENAIDAGGTEISVFVKSGGLRQIRVIDNGTGMGREDVLAAFQRYATSKIRVSEDIPNLQTLGFRGEALPSIASVSRVKVVTKESKPLSGMSIWLDAGQVKEIRETGCPKGTDITVEDIFFNTPARRKFQRSVATEFSHVMDIMIRLAMSQGGIHFKLFHNEKRILDIPSTKDRLMRIGGLLGKDVYGALHRVDVKMDSLKIEGYLSDPGFTRPNAKGIYVYVNGRSIRDRIIHHALMEGYRNLIPKDRYPVAIIFLHLPPWSVDINVHPTKNEVKFSSTNLIHRAVVGLSHGLKAGAFEDTQESLTATERSPFQPVNVQEPTTMYGTSSSSRMHREASAEWKAPGGGVLRSAPSSLRVLGQIARAYLVCESPRGLILIDQHAAHERILFQRLKREMENGQPEIQGLLFPETMELSPVEWETVQRYLPELRRVGFDLEPFGRKTVVIKSIPSILSRKDCSEIVSDLIQDLIVEEGRGGIEKGIEMMLKVTACHGAVRSGQELSTKEMVRLIEDMEQEGCLQTCPHGRPSCVEIGLNHLEKMFSRSS